MWYALRAGRNQQAKRFGSPPADGCSPKEQNKQILEAPGRQQKLFEGYGVAGCRSKDGAAT